MSTIDINSEQAIGLQDSTGNMPAKKSRKTIASVKSNAKLSSGIGADFIPLVVDVGPIKKTRTRKTIVEAHASGRESSDQMGDVQNTPETQSGIDVAQTIDKIIYLWRQRQRWHKAEKSLILQGKALCRSIVEGGNKTEASKLFEKAMEMDGGVDLATELALAPFIASIKHFEPPRKSIEKQIEKLAKTLPCWEWAESIKGVGALSYGGIIGEAGDILKYRSVAALWKRMGVAVIGDIRQRKVAGKEEALIHGYSPSRRAVLWNIGNGLIGAMGRGPRPQVGEDITTRDDWTEWQKIFVERCRYECAKNPEKWPLAQVDKDGVMMESYPKHVQSRAKRYVEKRFLRKLYAEWRRAKYGVSGDPDEA